MDNSYLLTELKHVRTVYESWAKETAAIEKFALVTTGAIWSWCATEVEMGETAQIILWAPFLICILFSWRARAIYEDMRVAISYLEKLEVELEYLSNGEGWHYFLREKSKGFRVRTTYWFWYSLVAITAIVANVADLYLLSISWVILIGLGTVVVISILEIVVWRLPNKPN